MQTSTSFGFRDILRSLGKVNNSNFDFTIKTILESVDTFTGHGISKEYATRIKEEILPGQTVESLNNMIWHARSAQGNFSHYMMSGRPAKKTEDEEK